MRLVKRQEFSSISSFFNLSYRRKANSRFGVPPFKVIIAFEFDSSWRQKLGMEIQLPQNEAGIMSLSKFEENGSKTSVVFR